MPDGYKYVIECQTCKGSVTMLYSTHNDNPNLQEKIKQHLVTLMDKHLKNSPEETPNPMPDPTEIYSWIVAFSPPPKPAPAPQKGPISKRLGKAPTQEQP